MDELARLKLSLKNLEYLKESRDERQRKQDDTGGAAKRC
jgi:hypothetical protein